MQHTAMSHVSRGIHRVCGESVLHTHVHICVAHILETCHITYESCHISQWVMSLMHFTGLAASQCCTAICTLLDALRETDALHLFTSIETALVSFSPSPAVAACCSVLQRVAVFAVCGCSVRDQLCPTLYEHTNCIEVLFPFSHCCSVLQCVAVCGCSAWDRLLPTFYKHRNRIGVIFPFSHCCGVLQCLECVDALRETNSAQLFMSIKPALVSTLYLIPHFLFAVCCSVL